MGVASWDMGVEQTRGRASVAAIGVRLKPGEQGHIKKAPETGAKLEEKTEVG
jgi:hypothetical protein